MERRGVEVTPDNALAAVADGCLCKGRKLAEVAAQAKGGEVAAHILEGVALDWIDTPAKRDALRSTLQAACIVEALQAAGLAEVLGRVGAGWSVDIGEAARIEALRAFIDTHRQRLEALGFSLPKAGCAPHLVREWLINRLSALGVEVERSKLPSSQRARGKHRAYYVTAAAVAEAWRWAQRPLADLVQAAELDAAGWAAAGVR
jgi:hypothetical protein